MTTTEHEGHKVPQRAQRCALCAFFVSFVIPLILLSACRVTEKNITGTYYPKNNQLTRLTLKEDKTFELACLHPGTDSLLLPSYPSYNFYTSGIWELDKNKLVLTSIHPGAISVTRGIEDSIVRFTNISCFSFWNRYGEPVLIRYILLPPARAKPHFGNSLYYFAQDFKDTDTLRFYFDGYPPFDFPGSIPDAIGNNMHKITLNEPYLANVFNNMDLKVKRNKLISFTGKVKFTQKK
jgi:hypothetical protein